MARKKKTEETQATTTNQATAQPRTTHAIDTQLLQAMLDKLGELPHNQVAHLLDACLKNARLVNLVDAPAQANQNQQSQ